MFKLAFEEQELKELMAIQGLLTKRKLDPDLLFVFEFVLLSTQPEDDVILLFVL